MIDPPVRSAAAPADSAPRATFGSVSISSHATQRGPVLVPARSSSGETVRVHFVQSGALVHRSDDAASGGTHTYRAGSAFTTVDPYRAEMLAIDACALVTVSVPLALLRDVGVRADRPHRIPAETPLLPPVAAFVSHAVRGDDELSSFNHYYFERLLQEMIVGVIVDSSRVALVARSPETFTLALSLIAAQSSDPDLSASGIAREVSLSLRQLERIFRERETTIGREIRRARIAQARTLLTDASYATLTVDQIARFAGFSNGSSLSRAMTGEGHPSPARVRAGHP